jgi:hypothetical protein
MTKIVVFGGRAFDDLGMVMDAFYTVFQARGLTDKTSSVTVIEGGAT